MSFSAAMLKQMREEGLTLDACIRILEVTEQTLAEQQSPAAVRQARYRERGGGRIPPELRRAVFERDGYACLDCGSLEYLHCDHVIPVSKGGLTDFDNLQTLCRPCNAKKKDRIRKRDKSRVRSNGNSTGKSADRPPNERDNLTPVDVSEASASSHQPRAWALPVGVALQVWQDFKRNRERKRLPNTETAWKTFNDDLKRISSQTGIPPPKLIEMCAAKGWASINDPREGKHGRTNSLGRNQPADGLSSTARAALEVFGR